MDTSVGSNPLTSPFGPSANSLTPREAEIHEMLLLGLVNKEISDRLGITVNTVRSHVRSILRQHGCANRIELLSRHLQRQRPA